MKMNEYNCFIVAKNIKDIDIIIMFIAKSDGLGVVPLTPKDDKGNLKISEGKLAHFVLRSKFSCLDSTNTLINFCKERDIEYDVILLTLGAINFSTMCVKPSKKTIIIPKYLKVIK